MRSGKLDREITIERSTPTVDDYGIVTQVWAAIATMRAQLVQATTEEFMRDHGASSEAIVIFRTRWLDGLTVADRVMYEGEPHTIKEIKEIGRRKGLEIRTLRIGQ